MNYTDRLRYISSFDGAAAANAAQRPSGRRRHKHKPGDEALCKYASKACYNQRVVKKTGEMHRYCESHRLQANRNQRRLELRRRMKERAETAISPGDDLNLSTLSYSSDGSSSSSSDAATGRDGRRINNRVLPVGSAAFEPFRHPVPLRDEDLSSLRLIFDEPRRETHSFAAVSEDHFVFQL